MTPGATNHLALMADANESENIGAESAMPELSLEEKLAASIIEAMTLRWRRIEKRLDRLEACPEVAAALARMDGRNLYGA